MPFGDYLPKPPTEKHHYDELWLYVSPDGADISGRKAVEFLRLSKVDSGILKQIWGLSTPTSTMNQMQFYSALRYITMVQNGEIPISKERLTSSKDVVLGLPSFMEVNVKPYRAPTANPPPGPAYGLKPGPGTGSGIAPSFIGHSNSGDEVSPYAVTPEELAKYHQIYMGYDTNNVGYLSASDAAVVLAKSGLDNQTLGLIWNLADVSKDNRLSAKEFAVAFHLIVCRGKKNLPVPPFLPPPLLDFLRGEDSSQPQPDIIAPTVAPIPAALPQPLPLSQSSSPYGQSVPPAAKKPLMGEFDNIYTDSDSTPRTDTHTYTAPSSLSTSLPASTSTPVSSSKPYVSTNSTTTQQKSNTDYSSREPSVSSSHPTPASHAQPSYHPPSSNGSGGISEREETDLSHHVGAIKDTAKRALAAQDASLDASQNAAGGLKFILQKLAADKVSLSASVSNAETCAKETSVKINDALFSVKELMTELESLRSQLEDIRRNGIDAQHKLSDIHLHRERLLKEIADVQYSLREARNGIISASKKIGETESSTAFASLSLEMLSNSKNKTPTDVEITALKAILTSLTSDRDESVKTLTRLTTELVGQQKHQSVVKEQVANAISRRENTDDKSENKKHEIQNKVVPKNFSDAPESKNVMPIKKAETVTLSATTNSVKTIPATNLSSTFPTTDKTGAMNGSPEKKNGNKSDSESAANKLKDNSNSDKKNVTKEEKRDSSGFDAFDENATIDNSKNTRGSGSGFEFNGSATQWGSSSTSTTGNGEHAKMDSATKSSNDAFAPSPSSPSPNIATKKSDVTKSESSTKSKEDSFLAAEPFDDSSFGNTKGDSHAFENSEDAFASSGAFSSAFTDSAFPPAMGGFGENSSSNFDGFGFDAFSSAKVGDTTDTEKKAEKDEFAAFEDF